MLPQGLTNHVRGCQSCSLYHLMRLKVHLKSFFYDTLLIKKNRQEWKNHRPKNEKMVIFLLKYTKRYNCICNYIYIYIKHNHSLMQDFRFLHIFPFELKCSCFNCVDIYLKEII